MRFNSLAFRLFTTAAAWTLLVLPLAGIIIYRLYRDDVQASFDGQLQKLVNAIAVDSMGSGDTPPIPPANLYEPLFEVTHSGWYWQIAPLDDTGAQKLVSASLATASLPSPAAKGIEPDIVVGEMVKQHLKEKDLARHLEVTQDRKSTRLNSSHL